MWYRHAVPGASGPHPRPTQLHRAGARLYSHSHEPACTRQHVPAPCAALHQPATPASRWVLSLCWPALPTQQHLPPGGFCLSVDSPSNPATPASRWVLSLCWPALPTQQHLPPGGLLSVCWQPFLHSNTCLQVGFCLSVDSPSYTATPASRWAFVCLLTALPTQQHLPPGGLLSVCWQPFLHSNTCLQGVCFFVSLLTNPSHTATPAPRWAFVSFICQPALPKQRHLPPGGCLSLCWPTLPTQQHLPPGGLLSPLSINQPFLHSNTCLQVDCFLSVLLPHTALGCLPRPPPPPPPPHPNPLLRKENTVLASNNGSPLIPQIQASRRACQATAGTRTAARSRHATASSSSLPSSTLVPPSPAR